jgi:hypothetical protein
MKPTARSAAMEDSTSYSRPRKKSANPQSASHAVHPAIHLYVVLALLGGGLAVHLAEGASGPLLDGTGVVLRPGMDTERFRAFLSEELPRIAALIARVGAGSR